MTPKTFAGRRLLSLIKKAEGEAPSGNWQKKVQDLTENVRGTVNRIQHGPEAQKVEHVLDKVRQYSQQVSDARQLGQLYQRNTSPLDRFFLERGGQSAFNEARQFAEDQAGGRVQELTGSEDFGQFVQQGLHEGVDNLAEWIKNNPQAQQYFDEFREGQSDVPLDDLTKKVLTTLSLSNPQAGGLGRLSSLLKYPVGGARLWELGNLALGNVDKLNAVTKGLQYVGEKAPTLGASRLAQQALAVAPDKLAVGAGTVAAGAARAIPYGQALSQAGSTVGKYMGPAATAVLSAADVYQMRRNPKMYWSQFASNRPSGQSGSYGHQFLENLGKPVGTPIQFANDYGQLFTEQGIQNAREGASELFNPSVDSPEAAANRYQGAVWDQYRQARAPHREAAGQVSEESAGYFPFAGDASKPAPNQALMTNEQLRADPGYVPRKRTYTVPGQEPVQVQEGTPEWDQAEQVHSGRKKQLQLWDTQNKPAFEARAPLRTPRGKRAKPQMFRPPQSDSP